MNLKKLFLLLFIFSATAATAIAQIPDTVTLKTKHVRYKKAIVTTKSGNQEEGFMLYHFPYSPDKEIQLIALDGNLKNTTTYKVKDIASINYPDLRYEQIIPD